MNIKEEIQNFKIQLLRKMPFYGDVLTHLDFVEDKKIQTAATDGKTIWYNPKFLQSKTCGERNFILMHEVFHVMLRHGLRNADGKRDRNCWNVACDIIVNDMLLKLSSNMYLAKIPFSRPDEGMFAKIDANETAENLYEIIKKDNEDKKKDATKLRVFSCYRTQTFGQTKTEKEIEVDPDIRAVDITEEEARAMEQSIKEIVSEAAKKSRGEMGSCFIPREISGILEGKKLDWRKLLKDFLMEELSDDTSYTTPERKYIHMDMILPGHSMTEERIEEIWAFVDSSGSVGDDELKKFLTQLYHISKEFKCIFNICYWDTQVTDVYKKVIREEDIIKCMPYHSGGTDINCVYQWIRENKVKPDVMLILTDGYFGRLTTPAFNGQLRRKTILVLSSQILIDEDMKKIGKVTRL